MLYNNNNNESGKKIKIKTNKIAHIGNTYIFINKSLLNKIRLGN